MTRSVSLTPGTAAVPPPKPWSALPQGPGTEEATLPDVGGWGACLTFFRTIRGQGHTCSAQGRPGAVAGWTDCVSGRHAHNCLFLCFLAYPMAPMATGHIGRAREQCDL